MEVLMRGNAFHYGTFNSHPVSAAAGLATLLALVSGDPQRRADDHARTLRGLIQDTLDRLEIAGFVYGESSTMHIYLQAPGPAADPDCSLARTESDALLSIPPSVVQAFQLALRSEGLDPMSYTGAVVSSEHGSAQLDEGAAIFETVLTGLRDRGIVAVRG
jgi:glutamate-1-semialdehyde aminotransferase